ncbi:MAG: efflux RND transporter periplasmic adaptor subunit [Pirellulales bacterium]
MSAVFFISMLLGCNRTKPNPPAPLTPAPVTVAHPVTQSVTDYREYTGRTAAIEQVEIRARVSGYLQSIEFKEGKDVAPGDLLFKIDDRPYRQAVQQAQANLAAQIAQGERYRLDLSRARELISTRAISQADLDLAVANAAQSEAQQRALEAAVARAQLDLEYTEIKSPIAGRTSRALVTPGNLITADQTLLTSVVSQDPIYAYFNVDESSALDYRRRVREALVSSARDVVIPITLGLADEKGHPHSGSIDFVDNVTDPGSGNIEIRGRFPNPDGALLPGLFARVRVPFTRPYEALLVPQSAVSVNQQGRYVLVVDADDKVVVRNVTVGSTHESNVVIKSGLTEEDRIIVKGLQKARPGNKVLPKFAEESSEPAVDARPSQTAGR